MDRSRTPFDDWHAIHTLVTTHAEYVDTGRFEDAAALFEHATLRHEYEHDGRTEISVLRGTAEVLAYMSQTPILEDGTPRTRHLNTNVNIDLHGDTATSRDYVTVLQQTPELSLQPIATGRYVDRFEFVDDTWRFTDRLVTGFMVGDVSQHSTRRT